MKWMVDVFATSTIFLWINVSMWKDIAGYEGKYQVSDDGLIRSLARIVDRNDGSKQPINERLLKCSMDSDGYEIVVFSREGRRKTFKVHRLVASAFILNPDNLPQVNHIDGNKSRNVVSNLEWCTSRKNHQHARMCGLIGSCGENSHGSKLTKQDVLLIVKLKADGKTHQEISELVQCGSANIHLICSGKTWSSVTGIEQSPKRRKYCRK